MSLGTRSISGYWAAVLPIVVVLIIVFMLPRLFLPCNHTHDNTMNKLAGKHGTDRTISLKISHPYIFDP
jgi:hypothetical protein